jgi:hypothetical protein
MGEYPRLGVHGQERMYEVYVTVYTWNTLEGVPTRQGQLSLTIDSCASTIFAD